MTVVQPVRLDWLVLLVNAYAPQTRAVAGNDAVSVDRVRPDQPAMAEGLPDGEKRRLAETLWPVFAGSNPDAQAAAFEKLLVTITASPHIGPDGTLTWTTPLDQPADVLAASCIVSLLEAITAYGWARLGTCAGCDCVDVYLDSLARGKPRKFCSTTCSNRAKVRAFRSRQGVS